MSEATYKYNCHSYAFYDASPYNDIWINDEPARAFYTNRLNYVPVSTPARNDRIVMNSYPSNHSAIVYEYSPSKAVKFISKWGEKCVFIHSLTDNPYWDGLTGFQYYRRNY